MKLIQNNNAFQAFCRHFIGISFRSSPVILLTFCFVSLICFSFLVVQLNIYDVEETLSVNHVLLQDTGHQLNAAGNNQSTGPLFHPYGELPESALRIQSVMSKDDPYYNHQTKCGFKGKVFTLGMFKTGTKSISQALRYLSYRCGGSQLMNSCRFMSIPTTHPAYEYSSHWWFRAGYTLDPLFNDSFSLQVIRNIADEAFNAGDGPWLFLYPLFDQWYPNSKYILTVRNSTWDIVNSDLKMICRSKLHKHEYCHSLNTKELKAFEESRISKFARTVTGKQLIKGIARRYEQHNRNVIEYFRSRNAEDQLLILNMQEERDPWHKVMSFLDCDFDPPPFRFPRANSARNAIEIIPKHYNLDWQSFDDWPDGF